MDLSLVFDLPPASAAPALLQFGVRVLGRAGPLVNISIATARDGRGSSRLCHVDGPAGNGPAADTPFPLATGEDSLEVRVLTDRSVAEFFVGRGRASRTMRHYPAPGDYGASVIAATVSEHDDAGLALRSADAFEMGCGWESEAVERKPALVL